MVTKASVRAGRDIVEGTLTRRRRVDDVARRSGGQVYHTFGRRGLERGAVGET